MIPRLIRKGKQTKHKVVHLEKIKPFKGKPPMCWSRIPETQLSERNDSAGHNKDVNPDVLNPDIIHVYVYI